MPKGEEGVCLQQLVNKTDPESTRRTTNGCQTTATATSQSLTQTFLLIPKSHGAERESYPLCHSFPPHRHAGKAPTHTPLSSTHMHMPLYNSKLSKCQPHSAIPGTATLCLAFASFPLLASFWLNPGRKGRGNRPHSCPPAPPRMDNLLLGNQGEDRQAVFQNLLCFPTCHGKLLRLLAKALRKQGSLPTERAQALKNWHNGLCAIQSPTAPEGCPDRLFSSDVSGVFST